MGNTNCRQAMTQYLMNQNALYRVRLPLALLVSIIGTASVNKMTRASGFIANFIVPIALIVGTLLVVETIAKNSLDQNEVEKLTLRCRNWQNDPEVQKNNPLRDPRTGKPYIIPELVLRYETSDTKKDKQVLKHQEYLKKVASQYREDMQNQIDNDIGEDEEQDLPGQPELVQHANAVGHQNYGKLVENLENPSGYNMDSDNPVNQFARVKAVNQQNVVSGCLMPGKEYALATCSGTTGYNQLENPIPGPTWQVQSAQSVQNRLNTGNYVPSTCNVCSAPGATY